MALSSNLCALKVQTGKDLSANSGSKSGRMAELWQFSQAHPKPAFSEKVQSGVEEKFFKNHPKSTLARKVQKNSKSNGSIL